MKYRHIYVSQEFYNVVRKHYPRMDEKPGYSRFVSYLLFPSWQETKKRETWNTMIPYKTLAAIEGVTKNLHNYSGSLFLAAIKSEVGLDFDVVEYSYEEGLCRTVSKVYWPEEILQAWYREVTTRPKHRVDFMTGVPYNKNTKTQLHQADYDEAMAVKSLIEAQLNVRLYLNDLALNQFTKVVEANYSKALAYAVALPESTDTEKRSKDYALTMLRHILDQPKQLYRVARDEDDEEREYHTMRLVPHNPGLAGITREIRKILTQGFWSEFDLKSAQLAICAALWGVPEVHEFLATGKSIWKELCEVLGVDSSSKDALKRALYGVVFGQSLRNISRILDNTTGIEGLGERFLDHYLIKAMLEARKVQLDYIMAVGGADDCYGNWIELQRDTKGPNKGEWNPRSVLALQAQALEFKLIYPIFELAQQYPNDFAIQLYQYDGVSIRFLQNEKASRKRILAAVKKQADALGINTYLEEAD